MLGQARQEVRQCLPRTLQSAVVRCILFVLSKAGIHHRLNTIEGKCPGLFSSPDLRSQSLVSRMVTGKGGDGSGIMWRQGGFSDSQRPTILVWPYKTSIPLLNQARVGGTVELRLLEWGPPAEAQGPRPAARETLGRSRTCMSFKGTASAYPQIIVLSQICQMPQFFREPLLQIIKLNSVFEN